MEKREEKRRNSAAKSGRRDWFRDAVQIWTATRREGLEGWEFGGWKKGFLPLLSNQHAVERPNVDRFASCLTSVFAEDCRQ